MSKAFFRHSSALAALLLSSSVFAGECSDWQSKHPNWIWCDDFESTTALRDRYEDVSTTGLGRSIDEANDGEASLRQTYEPGQSSVGWIIKVNNGGFPDHLFYRYYHKFGPGYTTFPPKMSRAGYRVRSGAWTPTFMVHTWLTETGDVSLDVLANDSAQGNGSGWLPVKRSGVSLGNFEGQWVAVEVEIKLNTPGKSDGVYRMWLNDQLAVESTNVDLRGGTSHKINEVMLDTHWNKGATGALDRYYDNFVISTSKIGLLATDKPAPTDPTTDVGMCEPPPKNPLIQASN